MELIESRFWLSSSSLPAAAAVDSAPGGSPPFPSPADASSDESLLLSVMSDMDMLDCSFPKVMFRPSGVASFSSPLVDDESAVPELVTCFARLPPPPPSVGRKSTDFLFRLPLSAPLLPLLLLLSERDVMDSPSLRSGAPPLLGVRSVRLDATLVSCPLARHSSAIRRVSATSASLALSDFWSWARYSLHWESVWYLLFISSFHPPSSMLTLMSVMSLVIFCARSASLWFLSCDPRAWLLPPPPPPPDDGDRRRRRTPPTAPPSGRTLLFAGLVLSLLSRTGASSGPSDGSDGSTLPPRGFLDLPPPSAEVPGPEREYSYSSPYDVPRTMRFVDPSVPRPASHPTAVTWLPGVMPSCIAAGRPSSPAPGPGDAAASTTDTPGRHPRVPSGLGPNPASFRARPDAEWR
mmetsp:Transcript_27880/g.66380  ORF Transcript_27880/g.66380 Transcript_27880/m.66380 type:complete len:407 (-) Transcript_27880:450-1670(-)